MRRPELELVEISSGSWLTNKDVSLIMRGRLCARQHVAWKERKCDGTPK